MQLTKSNIFWKSWWWSLVCGTVVASVFYAATSWFDSHLLGSNFFDILITLSIAGSYFGAGYVGWRIADKYYYGQEKLFVARYRKYSIITFIVLLAVIFSPISFLGVFWNLIPAFGVLHSLGNVQLKTKKKKTRR